MTVTKKCFVISPIGADGSPERQHADDVFDFIVRPAMEECGINACRADHLVEPGRITEQMFREIINADLCVAVLTGQNPNVFYELALAQAIGKPVVILLEKSEETPFDVQDLRCVRYDLTPRYLFDRVFSDEIVSHLKSLEKAGWRGAPVFGDLLSAHSGVGDPRFRARSAEIAGERWRELLVETDEVFEYVGMSLGYWLQLRDFPDLLAAKAREGCRIRLLICTGADPALGRYLNPKFHKLFDGVAHKIESTFNSIHTLAKENPGIEVRTLSRHLPHFRATRTDHAAIMVPYLFSEKAPSCPLSECEPDSPLYRLIAQEFDELWSAHQETDRGPEDPI